ncbi:hypothetical protein [Acinetobacter junii]|uniref:hypothetical protein n=1 Tax=Acinetobacter junii TaxID=40215 RepID=UPI0024ACB94F|nr:hypothetical protein [Acinetobacter junii]MDI6619904.1 hypothetical protein [Acinetobacter junii]
MADEVKGDKLQFNFKGDAYVVPAGDKLRFNFTLSGGEEVPVESQYVFPLHFDASTVSTSVIARLAQQFLRPVGLNSSVTGQPAIKNNAVRIYIYGFESLSFGNKYVYNKTRYVRPSGGSYAAIGTPGLRGGMRYLRLGGIIAPSIPNPRVINTREDKKITAVGNIAPPSVSGPLLSPRTIRVYGVNSELFGRPLFQKPPRTSGFVASLYGTPLVILRNRTITLRGIDFAWVSKPTIFDPTQQIYAQQVIQTAIFGEIRIFNKSRFVRPSGFLSEEIPQWNTFENYKKFAEPFPIAAPAIKQPTVWNLRQVFSLPGFDASLYGRPAVGYARRQVKPSGIVNQSIFGAARFSKTPELFPQGSNMARFGNTWLSHRNRAFQFKGFDTQQLGSVNLVHKQRYLKVSGFIQFAMGVPTFTHYRREYLIPSINPPSIGNLKIEFSLRYVEARSIYGGSIGRPLVGGSQFIGPEGFDPLKFGSRIIPEVQRVYPQGFRESFGLTELRLGRFLIKAEGFSSDNQGHVGRWGYPKVWNLRQYIIQYFIVNSGLAPPDWPIWMKIENRNRTLGFIGFNAEKVAEPQIVNGARALLAFGIEEPKIDVGNLVAYRIRTLPLVGEDFSQVSGWTNVRNYAIVVQPKGFVASLFGVEATLRNTRRIFDRIGNFESLQMGYGMVSYRVRGLTFEERYGIQPPRIELPKVGLRTRQIYPRSDSSMTAMGYPDMMTYIRKITPRWTMQDKYGHAELRNKNRNLVTRGNVTEEIGKPTLDLQRQYIKPDGQILGVIPKPVIGYRNRAMQIGGFTQWSVSTKAKVENKLVPPPILNSLQYIRLTRYQNNGFEAEIGYGIDLPKDQVARPLIRSQTIQTEGFFKDMVGTPTVHANSIMLYSGIYNEGYGTPRVRVKVQRVTVPGIESTLTYGKPRLTPHTIYAPMGAPIQAVYNHPIWGELHVVNSMAVFGYARVSLKNNGTAPPPKQYMQGFDNSKYGTPYIGLHRRFIKPPSINMFRSGWHRIGDEKQIVEQFDSRSFMAMGSPRVSRPVIVNLTRTLPPQGFSALSVGRPRIELFNRTLIMSGFLSQQMGASRGGMEYMPQSLYVGPRIATKPYGFNQTKYGTPWISFYVREIKTEGFDMFTSEYDYTLFNERMRVSTKIERSTRQVVAQGFNASLVGVLDIKHGMQYIRPDGNANQFRKGGF